MAVKESSFSSFNFAIKYPTFEVFFTFSWTQQVHNLEFLYIVKSSFKHKIEKNIYNFALNYTFLGQDRLKLKFSNLSVSSYIKQLYIKLGLLLGY